MGRKKIRKKWIIIGVLAVILIVARLTLPYYVVRYVNKILAEIPGYEGSISGVDIALIRGAYVIHDLKLFKVDGNKKVPFVDIPATDLSVEWSALFDGAIVGEVIFENAKLNFIGGDNHEKGDKPVTQNQSGSDVDWTKPLKKLMPLQINRLEITQGTISYYDFTTTPKVNISLNDLQLLAKNLNNAEDQEDPLPSSIVATASSIGGGMLTLDMDINVLKRIPDLDLDMKFEKINMPALNDFFMAYGKVDIEKGSFSLFAEITVDDGKVNGYVKPIAQHMKVVDWKKDKKNPLNLIWQGIVGSLAEIFENQKKDQFASRMPLEGNLNKIDTETWPAIWNIFRNAFVKAFEMNTENAVNFADAEKLNADNKSRKDERKERRAKRKAEREKRKESGEEQ